MRVIRKRLSAELGDNFGLVHDFNIPNEVTTRGMRKKSKNNGTFTLTDILYADDAAMFFQTKAALKRAVAIIFEELSRFGLILSLAKTETMPINGSDEDRASATYVTFNGVELKNTLEFKYLGLISMSP